MSKSGLRGMDCGCAHFPPPANTSTRTGPGKPIRYEELQQRRESEAKELAAQPGPKDWDKYGGVFTTSSGGYGSVTALTLNPGSGVTNTYSGASANGAANMTLTKSGAGSQVLQGANTHSGLTTVSAGVLNIQNTYTPSKMCHHLPGDRRGPHARAKTGPKPGHV